MTEPDKTLAEIMMGYVETLKPIFEMGNGLRRQLEADGWSPTMAEQLAAEVVRNMLGQIAAAGQK